MVKSQLLWRALGNVQMLARPRHESQRWLNFSNHLRLGTAQIILRLKWYLFNIISNLLIVDLLSTSSFILRRRSYYRENLKQAIRVSVAASIYSSSIDKTDNIIRFLSIIGIQNRHHSIQATVSVGINREPYIRIRSLSVHMPVCAFTLAVLSRTMDLVDA